MTKIMNYHISADLLACMMMDIELRNNNKLVYYIRARVENSRLILEQTEEVGTAFKPDDYIYTWQGYKTTVMEACDGDIETMFDILGRDKYQLSLMTYDIVDTYGPIDDMSDSDWFDFAEHNDVVREKFFNGPNGYNARFRAEHYQDYLKRAYQILTDNGYEPRAECEVIDWWKDCNHTHIVLQDGKEYALGGWNGEKYTDCHRIDGLGNLDILEWNRVYTLHPEYDWDAWNEEDEVFLDENGEEWDGIIRYHIGY